MQVSNDSETIPGRWRASQGEIAFKETIEANRKESSNRTMETQQTGAQMKTNRDVLKQMRSLANSRAFDFADYFETRQECAKLIGHLIVQYTDGEFPLAPQPITDAYLRKVASWLEQHPEFFSEPFLEKQALSK